MRKFKQSLLRECIALISRKVMAAVAMTLLVGLLTGQALAQTVPLPSAIDATNEIRRQEERDRAIREREEPRVDIRTDAVGPIAQERLPIGEIPCFDIHKIELRGEPRNAARAVLKLVMADSM